MKQVFFTSWDPNSHTIQKLLFSVDEMLEYSFP